MSLYSFGLNHKVAPIAVREKLALSAEDNRRTLQALLEQHAVNEAMILSTCNRTEVYVQSPVTDTESQQIIQHYLTNLCAVPYEQMCPYLYFHQERSALRHLLRVAIGLDSMVLGEPQILGQVKAAYSMAEEEGAVGAHLRRVFQYVFSVSKQIRSNTGIGANPVSVAFLAVNIAKQIFESIDKTNVMLIGSGQTITLVAQYLQDINVNNIIIAGRNKARATQLAERVAGEGISLQDIPDNLARADIVISATASPLPILGKGMVTTALKQRKYKPMLLVDIAAPRDIEAQVAELDSVYLYNLDDLQKLIEQGLSKRQFAAEQAEALVDAHVDYFMRRLRSLDANTTITAYREQTTAQSDDVLQKAQQLIANGTPAEEALTWLATNLTNKFMHQPSVQLRQAAEEGQLQFLQMAKTLFDLDV